MMWTNSDCGGSYTKAPRPSMFDPSILISSQADNGAAAMNAATAMATTKHNADRDESYVAVNTA